MTAFTLIFLSMWCLLPLRCPVMTSRFLMVISPWRRDRIIFIISCILNFILLSVVLLRSCSVPSSPSWTEYPIPYTLYLKNAFMNWIPYTLFMNICFHLLILNTLYPIHDGWASRSKFSKRARGLLPTWLHFTNSIRPLMTFVSSRVTLPVDLINRNWTPPSWECVWSIAIERLHESVCDQSQLNASMNCMLTN